MGLCCCMMPKRKAVKDTSTQTDTMPLIETDKCKRQSSLDNEAKCRSSLETALRLVQQAVDEDRARHYEEALSLYQHALVYFLESLNYETESENIKEKILAKCKQYLERAEKLAEHINNHSELRRTKPASLSEVSKSVAKWVENEDFQERDTASPSRNAVSRMYRNIARKSRESRPSTSSTKSNRNLNNNNKSNFGAIPQLYMTR